MRIAIIGSGISGLTAAWRLHREHDITVFEADDRIGGHTNTVLVELGGERHWIDTGFIVFNDRTYPNFVRLLDELGVASTATSMSFSVSCERSKLEYNGTSLNGLFAQRRNLLRPRFHRMLLDIVRFNREAPRLLDSHTGEHITVAEYLQSHRYSQQFADHYLLPMGSAIWSCPPGTFARFPIRFIIEFYRHHGLLSLRDRPTWRVIRGGSLKYVEALTRSFRDSIRLNAPVAAIDRNSGHVTVTLAGGEFETFDEVILACHSDQALRMLRQPTATELSVLKAFPYQANTAVLHTDERLLPARRRAWASWNYRIPRDDPGRATVTYNMNLLQQLESQHTFCVTLNQTDRIDPSRILRTFQYSHPVYTTQRSAAQSRHVELIRQHRTSFCGAYWGNGFHEDGVRSALAVCRAFESRSVQFPGNRLRAVKPASRVNGVAPRPRPRPGAFGR